MARKPSGLGTGFVLCQYLDKKNANEGLKINHCGSRKLDPNKDYSPIVAEAIALSRAMEVCHHWLYYSDPNQLYSDCKGLLDLFEKPLADVENQKTQKILEKAMNYHWDNTYQTPC